MGILDITYCSDCDDRFMGAQALTAHVTYVEVGIPTMPQGKKHEQDKC